MVKTLIFLKRTKKGIFKFWKIKNINIIVKIVFRPAISCDPDHERHQNQFLGTTSNAVRTSLQITISKSRKIT